MAFTVEDGTGLADANAYAAVAFVDSYHSDRGNATWTGTSIVKEQAIIRATDYVERRFGLDFIGNKEFPDVQALSFPRINLYDREGYAVEGVPTKLKQAIAEYALRALSADLLADPASTDKITTLREKIGPIETETRYSENLVGYDLPEYPAADALLAEYLASRGGSSYR